MNISEISTGDTFIKNKYNSDRLKNFQLALFNLEKIMNSFIKIGNYNFNFNLKKSKHANFIWKIMEYTF